MTGTMGSIAQIGRVWKAFQITGDEETFRRDIALVEREVKELRQEKASLMS